VARWAERLPPFEFYSAVLDGEGGRARMLARLGSEAADALDEFLNLALAHDDGAPPSLQGFLCWLRQGQREVKRDMEPGRNEVRVMTVHGAKGLEAPIVFLPDTCSTRSARQPNSLLTLDDAARPSGLPPPFLWPIKGTSKIGMVQDAKRRVALAEAEERNRLLYVALTRARDRLMWRVSKVCARLRSTAGTISSRMAWQASSMRRRRPTGAPSGACGASRPRALLPARLVP
jgi:ATP-dependent helicase/nuclease subunit A